MVINDNVIDLLKIVKDKYVIDSGRDWSKGSITYFNELKKEIEETLVEYKANKQVYLEDELGDIFWDYLNLLVNLEAEGKISFNNVFERALKKYSERVDGIKEGKTWAEIKQKQKKELRKEQEK